MNTMKRPTVAGQDDPDFSEGDWRGSPTPPTLFRVLLLPPGKSERTADTFVELSAFAANQLEVRDNADVREWTAKGWYLAEVVGPGGVGTVAANVRARLRDAEDAREAEALGFASAQSRRWR